MTPGRIVVRAFGGPEVLEWTEESPPEPGPEEVRVRVQAASVTYGDLYRRRGFVRPPLPFTPGADFLGVVEAAGEGVRSPAVGETVAGLPILGGYATHVRVAAEKLAPVPAGLDPAEAAALTVNYPLAWALLHRAAGVRGGETILVHAAGGGVGTALLQLARPAGLRAYGTASAGKHDLVRALGGIPIDYRAEDFAERLRREAGGADFVFDGVGTRAHLERSRAALREGGRAFAYGFAGAASPEAFAEGFAAVKESGCEWRQLDVSGRFEEFREDLARLHGMLARREIAPVLHARVPLREARRAHAMLEGGEVRGKVVLVS